MKALKQSLISALLIVISLPVFAVIIPQPPQLNATSYILVDIDSGQVLVEKNADKQVAPASLTKMMTSYIAVHEIVEGNATEQTMIPISVNAWKKGGSKMFVREGTEVSLIDLLRGIIIHSGNDASTAVAEYFSGSESAYASLMNQYAQQFGMVSTNYFNATGLPAKGHVSTARDIATLAERIIVDHPNYYGLYAEKYYQYNNIRQPNRNKLLWRDKSVDGLKTGHTEEAGYCLAASAKRDNTRLVAVVLGTKSDQARTQETQKLLSYGFRYYETKKLYSAGDVLNTERLWFGTQESIAMALGEDLYLTIPRGNGTQVNIDIATAELTEAPITRGDQLGTLTVTMDDKVLAERPLLAVEDVAKTGLVGQLLGEIELFFVRLFGQ